MKKIGLFAVVVLSSSLLQADISVTDRHTTERKLATSAVAHKTGVNKATPEQRAAQIAANQAKRDAKRARHHHTTQTAGRVHTDSLHVAANATGSQALVDSAGLQYFINTDITFSTTSSASGAASEASYTGPIVASTSAGGTTTSTLNDSYDGYNTICVSLTGSAGPCATGDANYSFYNQNGPATIDATVPATPECTGRQIAFPAKTIGALSVSRKVFVPTNDRFVRWYNTFTNTSGAPVTFNMITGNNLGSDSNTQIVSSSSGDNVATVADTWVSTFQNFSGNTSSDPRLGHVLQGVGAATPVSIINFADGDDNPYWGYSITLAPGQTKSIINFGVGMGTKAAANAQAATLATLPANASQCLSATELGQVVNFAVFADLSITKSTTTTTAFGSNPVTYTLAVNNAGPGTASSVSVSDTLPAGSGFVSATGTGWMCANAAGVVTCTTPTLAVGAAPTISLVITAPPVTVAGSLVNTATVTSATTDPTPANNSSTSTIPIVPASFIPTLSGWMLALVAVGIGLIAVLRRS